MKINMQCVLKYLKHDYTRIFTPIFIFIGLCIVFILIVTELPKIIGFVLSYIPSAYILLNVGATIIILLSTVSVAIFGNKEWFEYKPWKEGLGFEVNDHEPRGCSLFLFPAFVFGFCLYLFYWADYALHLNWESPAMSTIIFIALILIGTPIGCAIARCKEE